MNWPQIVVIAMLAMACGNDLARHGKTREVNAIASVIAVLIWATVLHFGGFWE